MRRGTIFSGREVVVDYRGAGQLLSIGGTLDCISEGRGTFSITLDNDSEQRISPLGWQEVLPQRACDAGASWQMPLADGLRFNRSLLVAANDRDFGITVTYAVE
jgi:hypothetical protein